MDRPRFPTSLCHGCAFVRTVRSGKGSVFLQCRHPDTPKYPPQPVRECSVREDAGA